MISSRCVTALGLAVTIRPPFGSFANAVRALNLAGIARVDRTQFNTEGRRCQSLDCSKLADPGGQYGIANNGCSRHIGRNLFKQLDPFSTNAVFEGANPGGVATRPSQAGDESFPNRIYELGKHDRHIASDSL